MAPSKSTLDAQALRLLLGGAAARSCLTLLGIGDVLQWRVEVSTPANSLLSVREGLLLQSMQLSPYSGSQCRTPPITLLIHQLTAQSKHLYVLPNLVLDVLSGLMLRQMASASLHWSHAEPTGFITPNTLMGLYLLNPLSLASCVSGSSSPLDAWAVIATCCMAVRRSWIGTAAALAVAIYTSPHAVLLLVPTALLLQRGPEYTASHQQQQPASQLQQQGSGGSTAAPNSTPATSSHSSQSSKRPSGFISAALHVVGLASLVTLLFSALFITSDVLVAHLPGAACLLAPHPHSAHLIQQLQRLVSRLTGAGAGTGVVEGGVGSGRCWASAVYGLQVHVEDLTPNMGQVWYFFTEMFQPYLSFFRFVIHALAAVLVLPLALRFPGKPVLLFTIQCLVNCMFKPYPSVADHALYLALIPLLRPYMALLRTGMLLSVTWGLLAVLEVSMWHQWINIESANSNFYYSISLVLGAWQTFLLVQLLTLGVKTERVEKQARLSAGTDVVGKDKAA